ncbi:MAG TPA: M48 family metalloprotease [Planctomycetota bacterium]|jgi:Zn-dependent protease with chaperone function
MRIVLTAILSLLAISTVWSGEGRSDPAMEEYTQRITEELRARDPDAAKSFEEANAARESKDWPAAERLYREVLKRQPDWHHAKRRLAHVLVQTGRRGEAIRVAREALKSSDCAENKGALIQMLMHTDEGAQPSAAEHAEIISLGRSILTSPTADGYSLLCAAQAACTAKDLAMLKTAVQKMEHAKPDLPERHVFGWMLATSEGDWDEAQACIDKAVKGGVDRSITNRLQAALLNAQPWYVRYWGIAWRVALWWAATFAFLFVAGLFLSALALRASQRVAHTPAAQELSGMGLLGGMYRAVMWASCGFYYLSLPLLIIVVAAVPVGIIYACLAVGRIPVKLVAIVVILALATMWGIAKSLFVRVKDEDPGYRLDLRTQPRFRQLLVDLARRLDTRPVDNVYLTPGTEMAVVERGGMRRQLSNQTERCLILGLGLLDGMRCGALRAVVAHEYGHFVNRDTAGGGFALAVRRSLMLMGLNLALSGVANWYNPAWLFLNGFYRVFILISHGASRLQEVLADRWAALTVGAGAFEEGLRHVIKRSVHFDAHATATLKEVLDAKKPLRNLYQYQLVTGPVSEESVAKDVDKALKAPPTVYDTHPAPLQRISWVHACSAQIAAAPGDDLDAWSLFDNREALERLMTERVRADIALNHGPRIPAEEVSAEA